MGLAAIPVLAVSVVFVTLTRHTPQGRATTPGRLRDVWRSADARSLSVLYLVTFGGFVGMVSFLPILLRDTYGVDAAWAASATALCAGSGSLLRPLGGVCADRVGGERVLPVVFAVAATALLGVAAGPSPLGAVVLLTITVGALGAGNGAVFQIVPRLFPDDMGAITGLVGAAGGLGGFLLPFGLSLAKDWTQSYASGLVGCAAASLAAALALGVAHRRWRLRAVAVTA